MHKRNKSWIRLGLAALLAFSGLAKGSDASLATDDVAYLTQLGLMRGHLLVGLELYRGGHIEHARTHMKHPESELYATLAPAMDARGSTGFAQALSTLAEAVESKDSSSEQVEAAYVGVLAGISAAEDLADDISPLQRLQVVENLIRTAAEEYAIGVVDGVVVNGHEYQDAFGFTQVAKTMTAAVETGDDTALARSQETVSSQIQGLFDAGLWPSVMPPESLDTDASVLFGAAARIEIALLTPD